MTDQEIRAKSLEISALIYGSHPEKLVPRTGSGKEIPNSFPPGLEKYLILAREIEQRIREGL
jgi:hypothetical protein